ncbi:HET-domain-containing protein, partial [Cenococcum geophilum 1.58]|uniref:HET-domain-containing protein n=1 Tax=Cenococcum geophilum 1.58 TaxID=794803 RepID=UPI00358F41CB
MRLLEVKNHDEFSLTEFVGDNVPGYAILSHTWGDDSEEVTFKDLAEGGGKSKAGYSKIRFCGEQAASDGLQYFWVDTCCIDKSSSTELTEAINSMFRWYRAAAKCYVYLSDVSIRDHDANEQFSQFTLESAFRKSRWFTRGWTLQELIAPVSVEFFSLECKRLGDKKSLERQIHEITGTSIEALQGSPLSHFAVSERMSWAENRKTKREEDSAYSLMGIFDIYMSPIYGEGRKNAFIRLQEKIDKRLKDDQYLRDLFVTDPHEDSLAKKQKAISWLYSGTHDETHTAVQARRQQHTGQWFLYKVNNWITAKLRTPIVWCRGIPGVGKTILMSSAIDHLIGNAALYGLHAVAYIYFNYKQRDAQSIENVLASLLVQLFEQVPACQVQVAELYDKSGEGKRKASFDDVFSLLLTISRSYRLSIVFDALDEASAKTRTALIQLLPKFELSKLFVLISSRPDVDLRLLAKLILTED